MNCTKEELLLYAVTDRSWLHGRTLKEQVKEALDGGVTFLQLREKQIDSELFLQEAQELKELCKQYQVPFVINDDVELALKVDADGVHVGQSDMEAGDVRKKLGKDKIIGVSAQTVEQAVMAEKHGADYLGVGAVFPTSSKDDAQEVDYETLKAICQGSSDTGHSHRRDQYPKCRQAERKRNLWRGSVSADFCTGRYQRGSKGTQK